ncbi:MAG: DUF5074 domain-containing protein, partial [Duncaniella sp.]|nr:DUF5074 domain-containing protein [Duncaniella sp.]
LIVDPETDKVEEVLSREIVQEGAGIGSIVKSKDGNLWISVAKNVQGTGSFLNCIVRVDPTNLSYEIIETPEGMYPPSNSWYAWTPDAFVASSVQNCLYWKGGPNRWFSGTKIYKFDCDTRQQSLFIDLEKEEGDWKLYGCALGVDPVSDEIYMALYHEFGTPTYVTRRYSPQGEKMRDYEMIMNYWFPSLPIFPERDQESGLEKPVVIASESIGSLYSLNGMIIRKDVKMNDFRGIPPGLYVWKSDTETRKILIR